MKHTELESFYPDRFSSWSAVKTTDSVDVVGGSLTIGNIYHISKDGDDTTSFPGAIDNKSGETFTATGTSAVFGGAELVDITEGKATEIGYFYGDNRDLQFKWILTYNGDGDCSSIAVVNDKGQYIKR